MERIRILHFPTEPVQLSSDVKFIIKKNGVKGDLEVSVQCPNGRITTIPTQYLDPVKKEIEVTLRPHSKGVYQIHIKYDSEYLPGSPFLIIVTKKRNCVPVFNSIASLVTVTGLSSGRALLNATNEFIVDGSDAGCNILFVGMWGQKGPAEEVSIKKMSRNIFKVNYLIKSKGEYFLAVKWGHEHVPGSPFLVLAS